MTNPDGAIPFELAEQTVSRLRAYAEAMTEFAPLPGGVILVADRNGVTAQVAFGRADLERDIATSVNHLFEIGSISKVFTSLLVNQLVDDGLLSLDEPITDVLPWVNFGDGQNPVTIAQLLSHTGGLVVGADAVPDELAQLWSLRHRANNPARSGQFHYSNVGFMLLGLATSTRAGKSFPDLVAERLLQPMGMTNSVAAVTHDVRPSMAVGYTPAREDRPWVPNDPLAPATWFELATGDGNIAATAADMSRLVMLLLEQGTVDGTQVVTPQALDRMTTPVARGGEPIETFPGVPPVHESTYGLGINVERVGRNDLLTHGGGMVGYSTFLLVDQTAGFGIVILTNANGDNLHSQLLARVAHADLCNRLADLPQSELPNLAPIVGLAGGFMAVGADARGSATDDRRRRRGRSHCRASRSERSSLPHAHWALRNGPSAPAPIPPRPGLRRRTSSMDARP